jgi:CHAD domain-containing protein
MHRQSKWFVVPSLSKASAIVARRALADRLRWLWKMLRAAAVRGADQPEAVHQLRVATRRAATVLQVMAPFLQSAELPWLEKQLKKLRRIAGAARDYDVLAAHYRAEQAPERAVIKLLTELDQLQSTCRKPIKKAQRKLEIKEFPHRVRRMIRELRKQHSVMRSLDHARVSQHDAPASVNSSSARPAANYGNQVPKVEFGVFARSALLGIWHEYRSAAQTDLRQIEQLHALRLRTKGLRYAMELLGSAFEADFRERLYPRIVDLQEHLGAVNDHAAAIVTLQRIHKTARGKKLSAWLEREIPRRQQLLVTAQAEFLAWWQTAHIDLYRAWDDLFSAGANVPSILLTAHEQQPRALMPSAS